MKINVAVLGATGMVGQNFIRLLENHPYFEVNELVASERSAGKTIDEATKWVVSNKVPDGVKDKKIKSMNDDIESKIVFSSLPPEAAQKIEWELAKKGKAVLSKAKTNRYEPDVPILVPEVNPGHLDLLKIQKEKRGLKGFVVTDPNCTTGGLLLTLKPLADKFQLKEVQVTTMQAISGGGYPGIPSVSILGNVIPNIDGEEDKIGKETRKILGKMGDGKINNMDVNVFASCNRVPVMDGHTECVHLEFSEKVDPEDVKKAMRDFRGLPQELKLPSAPDPVLIVHDDECRPQPELDKNQGNGMATSVGRVRKGKNENCIAYTLVSHNTIRGAAGAGILDAELLYKTGKLDELLG